ncbi:MAG TPA: thioredoxin family protein [Ktedonobacteraceae bacterium]|nr:thioredoxin family protein [Ktedonobacteraceae bacterium]
MTDLLIRLGILLLAMVVIAGIVKGGRLFVERQRRLAYAAHPLSPSAHESGKVRILAFGSADCTSCHTLQLPALRRLQAARGEKVDVVEVDAPASPELTRRYHVLTVPTTIILNSLGEVHAVNYGFANLGKLNRQVDELMQS